MGSMPGSLEKSARDALWRLPPPAPLVLVAGPRKNEPFYSRRGPRHC
jgi:hypothetical protein